MTELLYQWDSYQKEFDAQVCAVNEEIHAIQLDKTCFYPGGGGQPFDCGSLLSDGSNLGFTRARIIDGQHWHLIDPEKALLEPGKPIHGIIEWENRYRLMRTHTAMHILCGVIFRDYGAQVTGGDMQPLEARMDFEFESLTKELVGVIEKAVNTEVQLAHPIRVKILPREEAFKIPNLIRTKINLLPEHISEIRTVEIVGLDLQADGGTHVANTREVGRIHISDYKSKGKINKRIYVTIED
ncbi:MAG: alanyl-tRNA editing protein [Anaerolineaceae bacterium]|jgi:misacylated tRNA(Ala) deacylase|nr:MAG: alanyl-tRNA editing protein [Anaerolineaceae bacterium]